MRIDRTEARLKHDLAELPSGADEATVRQFAAREGLVDVGNLYKEFNRNWPPSPANAAYEMGALDPFRMQGVGQAQVVVRFRFDNAKRFISAAVGEVGNPF